MKKILIPTDFSPAAYNAAKYAIHIAQKIKAGIKFCNAIKVPADYVMAGQVVWPLEDYSTLKNDAEAELDYLTSTLSKEQVAASEDGGFYPKIEHSSDAGEVVTYVKELVAADKANFVIMGMSGAGDFNRLFFGSNSREMISKADFPILLIPAHATFKGINKIAFATDLSEGDLEILQSLAGLAQVFNAEILITHVNTEIEDVAAQQHRVDSFLRDVTCKINYPRIYYRGVQNNQINEGLAWLTEHGQVDMLAMVHRQQPFLTRLLNGSHTQHLAKAVDVPLLVLPEGFKGVLA